MNIFKTIIVSIFFLFCSCSKYKQDSVFHIDSNNLPVVINASQAQFTGDSIKFLGNITYSGASKLLRYGHIWSNSPILDFVNTPQFKFKQYLAPDIYPEQIPFANTTKDFDKTKVLYYNVFAINESGISYGATVQSVCSDVYFDRYIILEDPNGNGKIDPNETVKLRLFFKNRSPINSISPKIESIPQSNFLPSIVPTTNISLYPTIIYQNSESYADVKFTIAAGATSQIQLTVLMIDACSTAPKDIKDKDVKNITLTIK